MRELLLLWTTKYFFWTKQKYWNGFSLEGVNYGGKLNSCTKLPTLYLYGLSNLYLKIVQDKIELPHLFIYLYFFVVFLKIEIILRMQVTIIINVFHNIHTIWIRKLKMTFLSETQVHGPPHEIPKRSLSSS